MTKIVEIVGHHTEVEISMDRIIGEDHNMTILIEITLGEIILQKHKIIEVRILEDDIEVIIEMITLEEVEVGLGKGDIQVILAEMIEVVIGQDQIQEPVLTETELDILSVGSMIILLRTAQIYKEKKSQNKYNKCII